MEKEDVLEIFKKEIKEIYENYTDTLIVCFEKETQRQHIYKGFKLSCCNNNVKDIVNQCISNIDLSLKDKQIEKYDLDISTDNTIQKIQSDIIPSYSEIYGFITTDHQKTPSINKQTKIDKFKFYAIHIIKEINGDSKSMTIYRKYINSTKKFKQSFVAYFDADELKEFKSELIVIDSGIDAIQINGNFFIFNRSSFNSIFNFKDFYEKVIADNKDIFIQKKIITNGNQFINDCKNNGLYIKRLTKFFIMKNVEKISQHKDNVESIIKEYRLDLKLDSDNKIIYDDEKNINEILNLFLEHYVVSALTEDKLIAKAIDRYVE